MAEVALDQAPPVRERLSIYLSLMPGAVRASLRRPSDPVGIHLAGGVDNPESILPFLPAHLPRFKPGDRPLPGIDWELEELLGVGRIRRGVEGAQPALRRRPGRGAEVLSGSDGKGPIAAA